VLQVSEGWSVTPRIAADRKAVLAYIHHTTCHAQTAFYLGARRQRVPAPRPLEVQFLNLATGLPFALYDLNEQRIALRGTTTARISLPPTHHDHLLLVGGTQ
jgi:hypothetical protein